MPFLGVTRLGLGCLGTSFINCSSESQPPTGFCILNPEGEKYCILPLACLSASAKPGIQIFNVRLAGGSTHSGPFEGLWPCRSSGRAEGTHGSPFSSTRFFKTWLKLFSFLKACVCIVLLGEVILVDRQDTAEWIKTEPRCSAALWAHLQFGVCPSRKSRLFRGLYKGFRKARGPDFYFTGHCNCVYECLDLRAGWLFVSLHFCPSPQSNGFN